MAKNVTMVTPIGIARYVHLDKPDTKFDEKGHYNTQLVLDEAGFAKFKEVLDEVIASNTFKTKKLALPYEELDDDAGYAIKAKTGADYRPVIVDSKNNKLPKDVRIGGGSRLRLRISFAPWDKGVTLRLNGVQVIELAEWEGGSGFDEVEDGFEVEAPEETGFEGAAGGDALNL